MIASARRTLELRPKAQRNARSNQHDPFQALLALALVRLALPREGANGNWRRRMYLGPCVLGKMGET